MQQPEICQLKIIKSLKLYRPIYTSIEELNYYMDFITAIKIMG